ncbi:YwqG family protein [Cohnella terricola]|nr:YwqG family protein [Cohnella terricola]
MPDASPTYIGPANYDDIKELFTDSGLGGYWDLFKPLIEPGIVLTPVPTEEHNIEIGKSKIGGSPDLPASFSWPHWRDIPMSFLAQINLSELPMESFNEKYPREGIIYFFYVYDSDIWYEDPEFDVDQYKNGKVLYYPTTSQLQRVTAPKELREVQVFKNCSIKFNVELTIPDSDYLQENRIILDNESLEMYWSKFSPAFLDKHSLGIGFRFLGYIDPLQFGGYLSSETLLFQADSNSDIGMEWDSSGLLYFFIDKEDLINLDFENVMTSRVGT